ncbi:retrotransposon protein, putative, ty1-copia subclass [Tanacetum coccineum]
MEHAFLSQKGGGGGRGFKEKDASVSNIEAVKEKDLKEEPVAMEDLSPLVDQTNPMKTGGDHTHHYLHRELIRLETPQIDVDIPVESMRAISEIFANTAYGFFLGKRVVYPVVANYVRNISGKFGLVKSMLNSSTGLFSFQFSSMDGLNSMLENGPWFIRNHPLILRKWNSDVNLLKKDVGNVLVWVKLHGVPITAFSEDGLSAIAMKLGTLLMIDSYTSDMCLQSWGRSSYARVMIELWADMELKDTIVVAMPKIMADGYYTCTICVKYEWKPPRCSCCKVFGHTQEECPKNIRLVVATNVKKSRKTSRGVPVGPKVGFKPHKEYRPVPKKPTASSSELVDYPGDYDSKDEVASIDNDIARFMALERVGFRTQSLLEQGRDSYGNGDYDEYPYDDDMYKGQDLPQELQAICDNLDIRVRGRKKKLSYVSFV